MTDDEIPAKKPSTEQMDRTIDQRTVDNSENAEPRELRIEAAQLFTQATEQTRMALCVSDPMQDDSPIVYVNQAFVELTGYERDEIIGRNCRFLQGGDTSAEAVERIRTALKNEEVVVVDILNYRKDGSAFWNALHIGPIFDDDGKLAYFYGSQWDITEILDSREKALLQETVTEELQHRTQNLFAIVSSIVSLTARGETDVQVVADKVNERIVALSRAHKASIDVGKGGSTDLRTLIEAVVLPYKTKRTSRIELIGEPFQLPRDQVTPVGLALHELATNSVKYGSLSTPDGEVKIDWSGSGDELTLCWLEQRGPKVEVEEANRKLGQGTRLIEGALRGGGGKIDYDFQDNGVCATISMPRDALNAGNE